MRIAGSGYSYDGDKLRWIAKPAYILCLVLAVVGPMGVTVLVGQSVKFVVGLF